ncbi:nucleotide-diphospho-sugar transferase [Apiosordaria backusii]|uniref:Nucleotide-diphospho-sugar transferase n=1 Tax=Apiosordaria backusii TaxID=314023 RepID=A0AA40EN30_9PEZI|nr:nucleotide-diphospho-sugar transferase [Apiosordaria backusii]
MVTRLNPTRTVFSTNNQRLENRHCSNPPFWQFALPPIYFHNSYFSVHHPARDLDVPFHTSCQEPDITAPRESAAIVMLARNHEVEKALRTVISIEKHFNRWFHYPIVFLNDEEWDPEFISTMNETVSGGAKFEVVSPEEWGFPSYINEDRARQAINRQGQQGVLYGGLESYHHMCRFYSGKFYTLKALKEYKWYWRIEPDVEFYCALTYDPFVEMAKHEKVYGFTVALPKEPATCPSLFRTVADWKEQQDYPTTELWKAMVSPSWLPWPFRKMMSWFSHRDRHGDGWNLCHYWSNFEIASLDFFRSNAYQYLFEHLDRTGGFYSERWGDAPVHSLALGMLLDSHKVHHFEDIGYRHDWYYQCPANAPGGQLLQSEVLGEPAFTVAEEMKDGIGCRCECDGSRTRNHASYCLNRLTQPNKGRRLGVYAWARSWWP